LRASRYSSLSKVEQLLLPARLDKQSRVNEPAMQNEEQSSLKVLVCHGTNVTLRMGIVGTWPGKPSGCTWIGVWIAG